MALAMNSCCIPVFPGFVIQVMDVVRFHDPDLISSSQRRYISGLR